MKELSAREKEVLDLTETGYTQNQIAIKLSITRNAVKSYLKRACHKKVGGKTIAKNNK